MQQKIKKSYFMSFMGAFKPQKTNLRPFWRLLRVQGHVRIAFLPPSDATVCKKPLRLEKKKKCYSIAEQ